jgi:hypothetical protein
MLRECRKVTKKQQPAAPQLEKGVAAESSETQQPKESPGPKIDAATLLQALQLNLSDPKVRRDMRKQVQAPIDLQLISN